MELEVLAETQVTRAKVAEILSRAFIKHEVDDDGDFIVDMEGYRSLLIVDEERKLLKYMLSFTLETGTDEQKNAYANRLNTNYIFAGFYVRENSVVGEYYLPFDGGVLPYQIVHCLRLMHSIVPDVTAQGDSDNLLGRDVGAGVGGDNLPLDA